MMCMFFKLFRRSATRMVQLCYCEGHGEKQ